LEKQGFWKKYFRLWNKKRSGLCRKSEKRRIFFSKQDASHNSMEVQTFLFQNAVKIFATDWNE
jgi:hypothetical protein